MFLMKGHTFSMELLDILQVPVEDGPKRVNTSPQPGLTPHYFLFIYVFMWLKANAHMYVCIKSSVHILTFPLGSQSYMTDRPNEGFLHREHFLVNPCKNLS